MANNPYVNKVVYGNNTLIDLTDATATADKILQGYTAYGADGQKLTGTATGGGSGGNVWQDAQGYVHLDDEGTTPITVEPLSVTQNGTYTAPTGKAYSPVTVSVSGGGGLVYETGTWTPSEDTVRPYIYFTNTHSTRPFAVLIADMMPSTITSDSMCEWLLMSWYDCFNVSYPYSDTSNYYGAIRILYKTSTSASNGNSTISVTDNPYVTETYFSPYSLASNRYWRANRTYKWIAVWKPTT